MPNDRISDSRESNPYALDRSDRPAPVYLGHSAHARQVQAAIQRSCATTDPVLVIGETGTGKRTIAEILAAFSKSPSSRRITQIDTPTELASVGSDAFVYICPVEQVTREQQAELLAQVGSRRLVVGTRLDPDSIQGRAQLDPQLLRRCTTHIRLPSLRDQIEDLELLAMRILCESPTNRPIGGIHDYALGCLRAHAWPGNVGELEQVLREAIELGRGEQIELRDLPPALRLHAVEGLGLDPQQLTESAVDIEFSLAHAEWTAIERAMRYARGNKRKAAKLLQIGKTTLYRKLRRCPAQPQSLGSADD